jgi:tetratricopeptide (TPR) repeat protein
MILAGGVVGFLLSVPVGMLGAAPSSPAAVVLGLPLAIGTMWLLLGWVREGQLPTCLPGIGVVVLLVDLLAAGGIGLPSVAGTLWLLLALGLVGESPRVCRPWITWAAALIAIAVAVACYFTAYNPVIVCQGQMRRAERRPSEAAENLEAAAASDPWAAAPWQQLATIEFERWWQQPDQTAFDRFRHASEKALELAPNSSLAWRTAGEWYLRAFSKMDGQGKRVAPETSRDAVLAYRQAVQFYPNNAIYRAELAEAYRADRDEAGFHREVEEALRLDGLTPHSDKKLPEKVRRRLVQELGRKS